MVYGSKPVLALSNAIAVPGQVSPLGANGDQVQTWPLLSRALACIWAARLPQTAIWFPLIQYTHKYDCVQVKHSYRHMAQALWGASVLLALPVLAKLGAHLNRNQTDLVSSASAIGSVFAELFMVKSLLVFDPPQEAAERLGRRKSAEWRRTRVSVLVFLFGSVRGVLVWALQPAEYEHAR